MQLAGQQYRVDSAAIDAVDPRIAPSARGRLYMLVPNVQFREARQRANARVGRVIWPAAGAATLLDILGKGRYRIQAEYRNTRSRAAYPVLYEVTHNDGTKVTIRRSQREGADGACISFELGTFDLGSTGFVRVTDTGSESVTFNRMIFTYLGPGPERP